MNIAKLMKQAQQMQAGLAAKQEELAKQTVEATVGGGKVHVTATCAGDVLSHQDRSFGGGSLGCRIS